jgi:DNA-binding MarR family transcriptional regulator
MKTPNELALSVLKLKTRYEKRLEQQFDLHGINLTEYLVLKALQAAPDHTLRRVDLAQTIDLTASGITRVLAPMEKIGLVEKQANARDARVSLIKLTNAGLEIYSHATVGFEQACESVAQPLTEKQQEKLLDLLQSLL